jgi:hypothetical protein
MQTHGAGAILLVNNCAPVQLQQCQVSAQALGYLKVWQLSAQMASINVFVLG